eukprot:Phypoly_transcript_14027.p1 GENE.Phypoly_transcript_14027~~Phypoly_transcript_14027.p1  ORF type:complete len:249 (+),score=42.45 Phypoly_transcript_14027:203-949(+)
MEHTLLDLPLHVRGQIFSKVLFNIQDKPNIAQNASPNRIVKDELTKEKCNQYPSQLPPLYYVTLLCVNKQISSEVKKMFHKKKLIYKLDCLIGDRAIYPTWISIPRLSNKVDVIEANIRLSGRQTIEKGWSSGCRCCTGGPGPLIWSLAALLLRFVTHGPDFLTGKNTKVGTLIVNVENNVRDNKGDVQFMHSARLQQVLTEEIGYLLEPNDKRARELFKVVHGKIDSVQLTFTGKVMKEWKVDTEVF